jgi:HNH endonuclease
VTYAPKPVVITPGEQIVLIAFAAVIGFSVIRTNIARRQWIAWHVMYFVRGFIPYCLAWFALVLLMVFIGFRGVWIQYFALAVCTPIFEFAAGQPSPQRHRKIPKHIREAVIEEHIKRTGGFDPKTEEIDHIVPFSKGGGHTKDNLWVVPKTANRRKGNNMPMLDDWLRFTFRRLRRPRF